MRESFLKDLPLISCHIISKYLTDVLPNRVDWRKILLLGINKLTLIIKSDTISTGNFERSIYRTAVAGLGRLQNTSYRPSPPRNVFVRFISFLTTTGMIKIWWELYFVEQQIWDVVQHVIHGSRNSKHVLIHAFTPCSGYFTSPEMIFRGSHEVPSARLESTRNRVFLS